MQTHHIHSNICEIKNQLTRVGQSTHRQPNYATKFTNPLCCLEFSGWTFNPPPLSPTSANTGPRKSCPSLLLGAGTRFSQIAVSTYMLFNIHCTNLALN